MGNEKTGGDVGEGGDPGEAALAEHLEDHPCVFVIGNDCSIARSEDRLDDERKDDLFADVLDLVNQGGENPSTNNSRHASLCQHTFLLIVVVFGRLVEYEGELLTCKGFA